MCDARGACTNGTVCVGHSSKNVGECHASTTKYVVALSTRLSFDAKTGAWSVRAPRDAVEKNAPLWTESNWSPSIGAALVQPGSSIAWAKTNIMLACAVLTLALFASLKLCGKRNGAPRHGGGAERERLLSGERRVEGFGFARRGEKSSDVERAVPTPAPKPTPAPPNRRRRRQNRRPPPKPTPEPPKPTPAPPADAKTDGRQNRRPSRQN